MKHVYLALLACATLCVQTLSADPIGSAEGSDCPATVFDGEYLGVEGRFFS